MDLEAGRLGGLKLDTIRAFVDVLGARLSLSVISGAGDPRLLVDAGHAFLEERWKQRLERWTWLVRVEVSFNHYGERGRIDLVAYHPGTRILLVIEVKTVLWDVQATLGALDVKVRIARFVARDLGWQPDAIVPAIVFASGTTVRRRLAEHATLFAGFDLRGRAAISWLRAPAATPQGMILLTDLPYVAVGDRRRAGRRRVRVSRAQSSTIASRHARASPAHDA